MQTVITYIVLLKLAKRRASPGCSRLRFRFDGVPILFFENFVLSRFHGRYFYIQLTEVIQVDAVME